jgi:hypothetical protein
LNEDAWLDGAPALPDHASFVRRLPVMALFGPSTMSDFESDMAIKSGRRQSATRTRIPPIEFDVGAAAPDVGDKMERSGRGPAALHVCDSVRDPTDGLGFL